MTQTNNHQSQRSLYIGWWNTSLSPIKQRENSDSRWKLATAVSAELMQGVAKDILALGEVTEHDVQRLLTAIPDNSHFGRIVDPRRNVAVLYDTTSIRHISTYDIDAVLYGKSIAAGLDIEFESEKMRFNLIASHWPSRDKDSQGKPKREVCGRTIQERLRTLNTAAPRTVVVLGDFNDEPFDNSLTNCLQGTRDRRKACESGEALYNPFWRLLGERHPMEVDRPNEAGTYFSSNAAPATAWHTLDQALLSSASLQGRGWTLRESETKILCLEMLRTKRGMRLNFDHFPISIVLDFKASGDDL
jgi:Endonuclease/Exonuclease/phosphatase family